MSDNEHTLPILGDSKILAIKHLPFHIIPKFIQRWEDDLEGISFIMVEESLDILKE